MTSLSIRIAMLLFIVIAALVGVMSWVFLRSYEGTMLEQQTVRFRDETGVLADLVEDSLEIAARDVQAFALAPIPSEYGAWLDTPVEAGQPPAPPEALEQYLFDVLRGQRLYSQMRILDKEGWERARVNCEGDDCARVPLEALQFKGDRGYFIEAQALPPGELYVSRLELNRENGYVEEPHVPVIRVAAKLAGAAGDSRERGHLLVINIDVREVIRRGIPGEFDNSFVALLDPAQGLLWQTDRPMAEDTMEWAREQLSEYRRGAPAGTVFQEVYSGDFVSSLAVFNLRTSTGRMPVGLLRSITRADALLPARSTWRQALTLIVPFGVAVLLAGALALHRLMLPYRQLAQSLAEKGAAIRPEDLPEASDLEGRMVMDGLAEVLTDLNQANEVLAARVREQEALVKMRSENQELRGVVLDNLPVVVAMLDAEKRFTYVNSRCESWFNPEAASAEGKAMADVLDADSWEILEPLIDQALAGSVARLETTFLHRSLGVERWLDIQCHPSVSEGRVSAAYLLAVDIQSLKQVEREAAENAAQVEAVIEAAVDGIITIDGNGTVERVNTAALEMLGYREDELLGQNLKMIMPEPYQSEHDTYLKNYAATGARKVIGLTRELPVMRKDGSTFDIELSVSIVERDPSPFYLGIIRDVTDRVRTTAALRERETHLAAVIEAAIDGIITIDGKGTVERVNSAALEMLGYRKDELLGQNLKMIMPEPYQSEHDGYLEHYAKTGERRIIGITRELPVMRKDGSIFEIELSVSQVAREPEPFYLGIIRDVSERVEVTKALRASEERLALAIEGANDGLWDWSETDGDLMWWSPRTFEMLGFDDQEVHPSVGMFRELLHPDDHDAALRAVRRQFEGDYPLDQEFRLRCKDGAFRWFRVRARAYRNEGTGTLRVSGTLQLIHARKLAEAARVEYEEKLRRTVEELDRFAYIASHDLKAPLRAIDNLAKWVVEDSGDLLPEKPREYLAKMQGRIVRMERLLDDLLQYSRVGRVKGELVTVNLNELADEICELSNIPSSFSVTVDMPADPIQILKTPVQHVLQNLISNAVKHHDRETGTIRLQGEIYNDALHIIVEDDGPGIPANLRDKAFELFQTLRPRDEVDSSGLGLAIVKKLVTTAGGEIGIDPSQDRGTTFRLVWPLGAGQWE